MHRPIAIPALIGVAALALAGCGNASDAVIEQLRSRLVVANG